MVRIRVKNDSYDVVIAGGGLVGALTALLAGRARPDLRIAVIEPQAHGPVTDKRTIAVAAGTVAVLTQQGLWQQVAEQSTPIQHIHVSDRGFAGLTRLHAEQEGVTALGQVIRATALNQVLFDACQQQANIRWLAGRAVSTLALATAQVTVQVTDTEQRKNQHLEAALVVGADGQHSRVRQSLGINQNVSDYDQVGIIAELSLAESLNGWAYERFTETGPLALLPCKGEHGAAAALVWSVRPAEAERLLALPADAFVRACQQAFGYRAGRFTGVGPRVSYPLRLQLAEQSVAHRTLLIGNASHALHPIAGQGFNLGVRDALALAHVLATATGDCGDYQLLRQYWALRETDYRKTIGLTEWLVHGFSNHYASFVLPRTLALRALESIPPLRHRFAEQAMGKAYQLRETS